MAKDFDYYMGLPYTILLHPSPTGGYVVSIGELPGCVSQGETLDEALHMIEDAKRCWIDVALQDGLPIPEPDPNSAPIFLQLPFPLLDALGKQCKAMNLTLDELVMYHISRAAGVPFREEEAATRPR